MSFRTRLTIFFVLIVVVPMAAVGFLVFRLIDDSQSGKADARAAGIAAVASSTYQSASTQASLDARTAARDLALVPARRLPRRARTLLREAGMARLTVRVGSRTVADVGDRTAIAPGIAEVTGSKHRRPRTITVSEMTAAQYARQLTGPDTAILVRQGARTLASTLPASAGETATPDRGTVTVAGRRYRVADKRLSGFGGSRVTVSVLSELSATGGSVATDRMLAIVFIVGFLVLAFFFALLASQALQSQLARFLDAARRLGSGDFSAPIETSGGDEFAALGEEFNSMSRQLQQRLEQLEQERSRVRAAVRRIGEAFASGLDREALLEIALETAMDAISADAGRVSTRITAAEPMRQFERLGRLVGLEEALAEAEHDAVEGEGIGQAAAGDVHVISVALHSRAPGTPAQGLITVARTERPFTDDDVELLRTLAARASLALANVDIHIDIQRQATTDDLTGLTSHGRFQELLEAELQEARRYEFPVGLIMLDLDNFKSINDTYGHQQGDIVLRRVANILRETCRDTDMPARYGGEELAIILPHTNLEGAHDMAERVRSAIEAATIPRLDGEGVLKITASVGAASGREEPKGELIAAADGALYMAKHAGKNRAMRAEPGQATALADVAKVVSGE